MADYERKLDCGPLGDRLLLGAQPTHCSTCPINVGCYWGCQRAEDWAEQERLAAECTRLAKERDALVAALRKALDRCRYDMGYDNDHGPIGCRLDGVEGSSCHCQDAAASLAKVDAP